MSSNLLWQTDSLFPFLRSFCNNAFGFKNQFRKENRQSRSLIIKHLEKPQNNSVSQKRKSCTSNSLPSSLKYIPQCLAQISVIWGGNHHWNTKVWNWFQMIWGLKSRNGLRCLGPGWLQLAASPRHVPVSLPRPWKQETQLARSGYISVSVTRLAQWFLLMVFSHTYSWENSLTDESTTK